MILNIDNLWLVKNHLFQWKTHLLSQILYLLNQVWMKAQIKNENHIIKNLKMFKEK